jgi:hypothetical protein
MGALSEQESNRELSIVVERCHAVSYSSVSEVPRTAHFLPAGSGTWVVASKLGRRVGNGTVLVARLPVADTSLEIASARAAGEGDSSTRLPGHFA